MKKHLIFIFILLYLIFPRLVNAQSEAMHKPIPQKICFCPPIDSLIYITVEKKNEHTAPVLLTTEDLLQIELKQTNISRPFSEKIMYRKENEQTKIKN